MTNALRDSRAMTLYERIEAWQQAGRPRASNREATGARAIVDRWRKIVAGGNIPLFEARLKWDGIDEHSVIEALAWVGEKPDVASVLVPDHGWSNDLDSAFSRGLENLDEDIAERLTEWAHQDGVPFVELWAPWVVDAGSAIDGHEVFRDGDFSNEALDAMLRHLLVQIGAVASGAAYSQFNRMRSTELSALDDRSGNRIYRTWLEHQISQGGAPLFDEFPVLARQIHRLLKTWRESTEEILDRFSADRSVIRELLASGERLGPVNSVRAGLSDRHHGGRRVAVLVFESGERIVYKPRPLEIEAAFSAFLEWLMGEGLEFEPTIPKTIRRDGYGWMEHLEAAPIGRSYDLPSWFFAAGALLLVAHVLRGSDLHFDNVRIGEKSPVLIDLETTMHPDLRLGGEADSGATAAAKVAGWMRSSFQSTGMLSFLQVGPDGSVIDIGGLCGTGGYELADEATGWKGVGGDGLVMVSHRSRAQVRNNLPSVSGEPVSISDYIPQLQSGFASAYRMIMDRRRVLLDVGSVMDRFYRAETRVLLRPTAQYARVLQLSVKPACQKDGSAIGLAIEALSRNLINAGPRPPHWDLVAWERHDLENLDIPRWTAPVSADDFEDPEGRAIKGVIALSGRAGFERQLSRMSDDDLRRQLDLMALSLDSSRGLDDHAEAATNGDGSAIEGDPANVLPKGTFLEQAGKIADQLVSRAVEGEDGSLIWLDPVHLIPRGRKDHGVSYYLYSGSIGVALFLAAMDREAPGRGYREVVDGALLPVLRLLDEQDVDSLLISEGIGACHGLGGIVYGLTLVSAFLSENSYIEAALGMAKQITPEKIAADEALDIEGGAAGAILGLLALFDQTGDEDVLETARTCGRWLVKRQQRGSVGGAAWPSRQGGMLAGFAHGASGNALALVRLWRRTGESELLEAARCAIDFENTLFDASSNNWPLVLRDADGVRQESRNMVAWCHGAPGVALGRALIRDVLLNTESMDTLDAALETTLKTVVAGPDHLCCGTLGRVEVLFTVGRVLKRAELLRSAESRAAMVIRLATGRDSFLLDDGGGPARVGFFRGLAGVGYQMLRLARPDDVGSVLAFEPAISSRRTG